MIYRTPNLRALFVKNTLGVNHGGFQIIFVTRECWDKDDTPVGLGKMICF